jgi:ferredoxin
VEQAEKRPMRRKSTGGSASGGVHRSGKSIRVAPGETVHAAAAKLGLMIPKACGMGICGTCKVLKLGGEVEMEHNGGITEEDEAEGYILSCCSVPKGDVRSNSERASCRSEPARDAPAIASNSRVGFSR